MLCGTVETKVTDNTKINEDNTANTDLKFLLNVNRRISYTFEYVDLTLFKLHCQKS